MYCYIDFAVLKFAIVSVCLISWYRRSIYEFGVYWLFDQSSENRKEYMYLRMWNVFYRGYNDQNSLVPYLQTIFCCNVTNLFRLNIYKNRPIKYSRETESKKILSSYDTIEMLIVLRNFT